MTLDSRKRDIERGGKGDNLIPEREMSNGASYS